MQLKALALSFVTLLAAVPAFARQDWSRSNVWATYDTYLDHSTNSVASLACASQLQNQHWNSIGDVWGGLPYLVSAPVVGWSSDHLCGSCWRVDYLEEFLYVALIDEAAEWSFSTEVFEFFFQEELQTEVYFNLTLVPHNEQWRCNWQNGQYQTSSSSPTASSRFRGSRPTSGSRH